jgi:hypothetical protein
LTVVVAEYTCTMLSAVQRYGTTRQPKGLDHTFTGLVKLAFP